MTAAEAREAWKVLRADIFPNFPELLTEVEWEVCLTLCHKYFGEGAYGRCFDIVEPFIRQLDREGELEQTWYAALGGRAAWLRRRLEDSSLDDGLRRYIQTALAYASRNSAAVLDLTNEDVLERDKAAKSVTPALRGWLLFIRAMALVDLGRPRVAYELLGLEVLPLRHAMIMDDDVKLYAVFLSAKAAEQAGLYADALILAERLARLLDGTRDVSWVEVERSVDSMVERLRARLEEAGGQGDGVADDANRRKQQHRQNQRPTQASS